MDDVNVPVVSHDLASGSHIPTTTDEKITGYMRPGNYETSAIRWRRGHCLSETRLSYAPAGSNSNATRIDRGKPRTPEMDGFQLLDLHDYLGQARHSSVCLMRSGKRKATSPPKNFAASTVRPSRLHA